MINHPDIRFDRITDGYGKLRQGSWQVIYKTKDGLDYCRETHNGVWSKKMIEEWVRHECIRHKLPGAVIERW